MNIDLKDLTSEQIEMAISTVVVSTLQMGGRISLEIVGPVASLEITGTTQEQEMKLEPSGIALL